MKGTVYLVGAGPGAPDLLTLRAAEVLARAQIVFYDALVHPDTLALAAHAETIAVGKRSGRRSTAQRFINKQLIDAARKHPIVVRLKGGDPMLFGRAQEEIDALRAAGIAFEIVPGVTAASAASAALGVSLTRRGLARKVTFVTPRAGDGEPENDWVASVLCADTAVIYMGAGLADSICSALVERGLSRRTPIALVENASLPAQRILHGTLADLPSLAERTTGGPVVIVVGEVLRAAAAEFAPELRALLRRA
jgi:uroporphyrin-III C-methyltransferase